MIKNFNDKQPKIHNDVYLSETCVIIGDVVIEKNSNIWFGSVLRGDVEFIHIGENSNIQENSVLHGAKNYPTVVGRGCTIGHCAIIHGCTIGDNTLIGMGSCILNGAKIGKNSIVGANSLVTQNKEFEDGVLILGNPAKIVRKLTDEEIEANRASAINYVNLSKEY